MKHLLFNPHRMNAILQRGFDQTNLVGSVGGVTYRRVGGVTVASQKVPMHVSHTQTAALMLTRMKWVNLVALWKVINQTGWHPSFQRENRRISDFNMFLRTNFESANTFITKGISRSYGSVVAPVRLTSGSTLVEHSWNIEAGAAPTSDLIYNGVIGNSTTLKDFSNEIVNSNEGWEIGDKLTILIVHQLFEHNIPYGKADALSVTLRNDDDSSTTLLKDVIDISLLDVVDYVIALSGPVVGGVATVQSRIVDGETICSPATLDVQNNYLSNYQGLAAFNAAAESYGGIARNQLLTPDRPADFDLNVTP